MSQIENDADRLGNETTYYILSPYKALLAHSLKITLFMFAAYILSANTLFFCIMVPIYVLCGYLYYKLWLLCKKHALKPLPFLFSIILLNIPFFAASFFVRSLFAALIAYL
jgi:hypothetical protein